MAEKMKLLQIQIRIQLSKTEPFFSLSFFLYETKSQKQQHNTKQTQIKSIVPIAAIQPNQFQAYKTSILQFFKLAKFHAIYGLPKGWEYKVACGKGGSMHELIPTIRILIWWFNW